MSSSTFVMQMEILSLLKGCSKNTETLIKNLGKGKDAEDFAGCRECSICLGSVLVSSITKSGFKLMLTRRSGRINVCLWQPARTFGITSVSTD